MSRHQHRPCYGGVSISRDDSTEDPDFNEDLGPTPFHDHSAHTQQNSIIVDADSDHTQTTNANNVNAEFASAFAPVLGEGSTKRLPAASNVVNVKCYATHIHIAKSHGTRDNPSTYSTVKQIASLKQTISKLIDPDVHDMFGRSYGHRIELTCVFPKDVNVANPSPEWFSYMVPVLQKLKNQLRIFPICNEDVLADITAMQYWLATPGHKYFPESLLHHNPFFGWGRSSDRRNVNVGKNNITEIGRNIVALYLNTMGWWCEKYGRMFGTEFHGASIANLTAVTNEEALLVSGESEFYVRYAIRIHVSNDVNILSAMFVRITPYT